MGWMRCVLSIALVCAASASGQQPAASSPAAETDGIVCRADADCPVMACGPCTPGSPITEAMRNGPSCAVNPCLDGSAVCSADHRCEIGPRTRKNPAVWNKTRPR
jgi:hypothetical protein